MNMIEKFLKALEEQNKSDLTIKFYRDNLKQFYAIMCLNDSDLKDFDTQMFYEYVSELKKDYALTSVNQKIGTLRSFFHFLYDLGEVSDERYKMFKELILGEKIPVFLQPEEAIKLLNTARNQDFDTSKVKGITNIRDRMILEIFLDTGVRAFELTNMKISNINFNNGEVLVLGKGRVERCVRMSPNILSLVQEWLDVRKKLKIKEGFEDFLLITYSSGENLKKRRVQYIIENFVKKSEIKSVSLHKLRHTYASIMLSTGKVTPKQLQSRMGHTKFQTTERYVHAITEGEGYNPLFE